MALKTCICSHDSSGGTVTRVQFG